MVCNIVKRISNYRDSIFPNMSVFMTRIYDKLAYSYLENLVLQKDRCQNLRIYYVSCRGCSRPRENISSVLCLELSQVLAR